LQFNNKTGSISGAFHHYGDYLIGIKVKDNKLQEIQVLIKITIVIKNTTTPKFIFYQRSMLQIKYEIKQLAVNSANTLPAVDSKNQTKPAVVPAVVSGGSVTIVPSNDQSKTTSVTPQIPAQP
jgi:hypothetical protein